MAIKINGPVDTATSLVKEAQKQQNIHNNNNASVSAQSTPTASSDSVTLTPTAEMLRKLEQQLAEMPVVDQAKVDKIRTELASGQFRFDPQRVADKMLAFENQLSEKLDK